VTHLLALVLLIGIVDAANPATIAPALYFASGKEAETSLVGFIAGVFFTNLLAGVLLAIGPGQALMAIAPRPGPEARHLIEFAGGCLTLLLAVGLWFARRRLARHVAGLTKRIDGSSLLVGAGIVVVELPTALPYFAVIASVVGSDRSIPTQIVLLAIFNAMFVLPLVAILAARTFAGDEMLVRLERIRESLDQRLAALIPGLVGLVAIALLAIGGYGVFTDR
jgi:cytochrome c biogenesis protein CcdA